MAFLLRPLAALLMLGLLTAQTVPAFARTNGPENCAARPNDLGRLWKVTDGKSPPSYIFGTMHSKDPRILQLPGIVMQAFTSSRTAIFETSLRDQELAATRQFMLLRPGNSLKAKIDPENFARLAAIAARYRIDPATLDHLKIWAAAAVISQPPPSGNPDSGQFTMLDKELEKLARRNDKTVIGLETNMEQMSVFDNMSEAAQIEYLEQTMREYAKMDTELETIASYYLAGHTGWIACNLEGSLIDASPELVRVMTTKLIDERNRRMVSRMLPALARGNAFVGIGALHLPGADGVLALLQKHGYRIERKY
ncbi:MAG: TraB/GumN family protein [Alphaproteobacteria bacterium]|nr:MAG: TraB/GumN family protein [Alphaproteobacteria bacterium]